MLCRTSGNPPNSWRVQHLTGALPFWATDPVDALQATANWKLNNPPQDLRADALSLGFGEIRPCTVSTVAGPGSGSRHRRIRAHARTNHPMSRSNTWGGSTPPSSRGVSALPRTPRRWARRRQLADSRLRSSPSTAVRRANVHAGRAHSTSDEHVSGATERHPPDVPASAAAPVGVPTRRKPRCLEANRKGRSGSCGRKAMGSSGYREVRAP